MAKTNDNKSIDFTHIRRVGDELPKEDLFVGIEGVDDQRHKLSDLSLEGKGLSLFLHGLIVCFRHLDRGSKEMSRLTRMAFIVRKYLLS